MLGLFFGDTKDDEDNEPDSKELDANGQLIIDPE